MSIDITNYYNYLNKISSNINERLSNIKQEDLDSSGITGSESADSSSANFELSFLSMINKSQPVYQKLADVAETSGLSSESMESASELYDDLTTILNSYNKMKAESTVPASIKESLFSMLNDEKDSDNNMFPDYKSELNLDDIIAEATKNL